jgi:hypothetical protein
MLRVDGKILVSMPALTSATGSFGATYGRVDVACEVGDLSRVSVHTPARFHTATRDGQTVSGVTSTLNLQLGSRLQSTDLWTGEPATPGEIELRLVAGKETSTVRGLRNRRGEALAEGTIGLPPGVYRVDLPPGLTVEGVEIQADGTVWLGGEERVSFRGAVPEQLTLTPVRQAVPLAAQLRKRLPKGLAFEAEANWSESGGAIRVSGGGHDNTSGDNNLWAWNMVGHTLTWTLDVPQAGDYELWFVGATECGMVGDLQVNGSDALALVFTPTGGWGRKRASEWRAYRVQSKPGSVAVFPLKKGKNRVSLTNRSGMGLNLDQLVLVRR